MIRKISNHNEAVIYYYMLKLLNLSILILLISGCTGYYKGKALVRKNQISFDQKDIYLESRTAPKNDFIDIQFIATGVFLIQKGNAAILTDPFFSNTGPLLCLPFKKINPQHGDTVKRYLTTSDKNLIKGILTTHSHYDHILDAGFVFKNYCDTNKVKIYGSKTTRNLLYAEGVKASSVVDVSSAEAHLNTPGQWFYLADSTIRFMPLQARHSPQSPIGLLYKGTVDNPQNSIPHSVCKWKEGGKLRKEGGGSINYIIDFLNPKKEIDFRIQLAQSGTNKQGIYHPDFEPKDQHPTDLLIMHAASFKYVHNSPGSQIHDLKPKVMILGHWENFFRPLHELYSRPMVVPGTNMSKFIRRMEKAICRDHLNTQWVLPANGAKVCIYY